MKQINILLIFLCGFGCVQTGEPSVLNESKDSTQISQEQIIETILFDADRNGTADQIILSDPPVEDPGEFRTININWKGGEVFQYKNPEAWSFIPDKFKDSISREIGLGRVLSVKANERHYLMLFGYPFSCCPQRLTVISIGNNSAETIFDQEFALESIRDLDGNGTIELVGREQLYQISRATDSTEITTYVPFMIYSFGEKLELNKGLTKIYNETNYVFAGFEFSEEIEVALPKTGFDFKPFIIYSGQAE